MISFNVPPYVGAELDYIKEAVQNRKICGDGKFTKLCNTWLEEKNNVKESLAYNILHTRA